MKTASTNKQEVPAGDDKSTDYESSNDDTCNDGDDSISHDESISSPWYSSGFPSASSSPATTCKDTSPESLARERNTDRLDRMEKVIESINTALSRFKENVGPKRNEDADKSWGFSNDVAMVGIANSSSSIRWDHIKPFPTGIAVNKMWEEWNRYIENFEIAASLSNVTDSTKRTQLLFLSMGNDLQGIIKAAKLRPSLTDPNCYATFVTNIQNYLCSMTDTAAEHESFSRMRQENGESAVAFHARLMCKVRSCKYSVDDEDRFVRAQLLTGLRNKELVKQAKIYGYTTNFIVQSASRDEAFGSEVKQQEDPAVFEVQSRSARRQPTMDQGKRRYSSSKGGPAPKRYRPNEGNRRFQGRRSRCPRCFLFWHRDGQCPALQRTCNECGQLGHYAACCRQNRVNFVQDSRRPDDDGHEDNKQV